MDLRSSRRRAMMFAAALLASGLLLSPAARADEPGQDEVTLKNGGSIRGTVVSSEPGTSVKIIELGQAQARVIPWSQVSDVEKGKYAPAAPAQPGPGGPGYAAPRTLPGPSPMAPPMAAPAPEPEPKMGDPGVVRLHIDSPQPATVVEQRATLLRGGYGGYGAYGGYGSYGLVVSQQRTVCESPCDTVVDGRAGHVFKLVSDQYPVPGPISFVGMSGDVTLHLQPGSIARRTGGTWAIVLGACAAVTGAIVLPIAVSATTTDLNTMVEVNTPQRALRSVGIGFLAGGLAALGTGIALVVTGATHLTLEPGAAAPPAKAARLSPRYWLGEF